MNKVAIAIHGGAGDASDFVKENFEEYQLGLKAAVEHGYELLKQGMPAIDVVEATVKVLEDHPLFNAGKGAALNCEGEVEMDAAIMDGKTLHAGAVSMIRHVKNPIGLARAVMDKTQHVYIAGYGAQKLAEDLKLPMEPNEYFITKRQQEQLESDKKGHGTVGCVALDSEGNLAAATSTGGISNSLPGRIGDSCIIGAGCYANANNASSCTGDGELIITGVTAHKVSMLMELKNMSLQEACDFTIRNAEHPILGEVGIISINKEGDVAFSFNCDRMHRASIDVNGKLYVNSYKE